MHYHDNHTPTTNIIHFLICQWPLSPLTHSTGERSDWRQQPECARSRWWRRCRKWRELKRRRTWPETLQLMSSWHHLRRGLFTSRQRHLSQKWWRRTNTKLSKDKGCRRDAGSEWTGLSWMNGLLLPQFNLVKRKCANATVQSGPKSNILMFLLGYRTVMWNIM